mgnify:CR=1 FL=1
MGLRGAKQQAEDTEEEETTTPSESQDSSWMGWMSGREVYRPHGDQNTPTTKLLANLAKLREYANSDKNGTEGDRGESDQKTEGGPENANVPERVVLVSLILTYQARDQLYKQACLGVNGFLFACT